MLRIPCKPLRAGFGFLGLGLLGVTRAAGNSICHQLLTASTSIRVDLQVDAAVGEIRFHVLHLIFSLSHQLHLLGNGEKLLD